MKNCIKKGVFLDELKIFDIKKKIVQIKKTIDLEICCLICQKCLKGLYTNKLIGLWKKAFTLPMWL